MHGALLGDAYAEKHGNGTRISFNHSSRQISFLRWMLKFLANKGYCNNTIPKISKQIGKGGQIYYSAKFHTFTFSSFDWIRERFYIDGKKVVPKNIEEYLSPLAVAVWIMGNGHFTGSGLQLHTECFSPTDIELLCKTLTHKYGWKVSTKKKRETELLIYIWAQSMPSVISVVGPFLDESMKYKIGVK